MRKPSTELNWVEVESSHPNLLGKIVYGGWVFFFADFRHYFAEPHTFFQPCKKTIWMMILSESSSDEHFTTPLQTYCWWKKLVLSFKEGRGPFWDAVGLPIKNHHTNWGWPTIAVDGCHTICPDTSLSTKKIAQHSTRRSRVFSRP